MPYLRNINLFYACHVRGLFREWGRSGSMFCLVIGILCFVVFSCSAVLWLGLLIGFLLFFALFFQLLVDFQYLVGARYPRAFAVYVPRRRCKLPRAIVTSR